MKITAKGLTKIYVSGSSKIVAVNSVDFEAEGSGFIAIIGRSGSGKSTLLNLIGLNDNPSSGHLFIDGKDSQSLGGRQKRSLRLRRVGFVFQNFNLLPMLSAIENVELPMSIAGVPVHEQNTRATRLLETVGLMNRASHRPKQLSMGEQQRVAVARALANGPEVIIADEPTGELDSKTAGEIASLLHEIALKEGRLIIAATHDEKLAELADRVYRIEDGKLGMSSVGVAQT